MVEPPVLNRATSALSMKKDVNVTYTELHDFDTASKPPHHHYTPSTVQAWPTQPKPLILAQKDQVLWTIFDVVLIALPVCLIVKTGLCIYAHIVDKLNTGIYVDSASLLSQGLIQLNAQLVTLFTIVFITIMSTFVKRYALWKAQYGACISDLEQLQGSVSLPSTLKLIWSLRSFGVKSMILALVWSFYYLGSQAVKLEYRLSPSANHHNGNAAVQKPDAPSYFSPDLESLFEKSGYSSHDFKSGSYLDRLNTQFGAMLLEDQDDQDENLHGKQPNPGTRNGPLIPDYYAALSSIEQNSLMDEYWHKLGGWIDVSKQSSGAYVSMTGQALWLDPTSFSDGPLDADYPTTASFLGTYTLYNISYLNVSCSNPVVHPVWAFPNGTISNSSFIFNTTLPSPGTVKDHNGYPLRQLNYWARAFALDPMPGGNDTFPVPVDYDVDKDGPLPWTLRTFSATCNLTTKYVDMKVSCLTTGCYPSRLRWASNTDEYNATGHSTPFDSETFATNFLSNFTLSPGQHDDANDPSSIISELDWAYPYNQSFMSTLGPAQCYSCSPGSTYENTRTPSLSTSLTQLFNTYYMLSQAVVSDYMQPDMSEIVNNTSHEDALFKLVHANGAALEQAYRIYWQWIPVDFAACSILLAAAIGAYWLRINTLAPDIFGYVSSLTRDNPHIQLPTEGSALSGMDRARMLKGVRVRIGDVQSGTVGESSVGRIGLAPVNAELRPLHSGGVYI